MNKQKRIPLKIASDRIRCVLHLNRIVFGGLVLGLIVINSLFPHALTLAEDIPGNTVYLPMVITGSGVSQNDPCESVQEEWLCRVNTYRQLVNQAPVRADETMSYATGLHDNYLILNGDKIEAGIITNFHEEREGYPGYTDLGKEAGSQSNIVWYPSTGYTVKEAVDIWMTYSSHRYGILHPDFNTSGFDLTCENGYCASSLNVTGSLPPSYEYTEANIVYPVPGQTALDPNTHITWGFYRPWLGEKTDANEVYFISGSILDPSGKSLRFSVNEPNHDNDMDDYKNQVALIPEQAFQSGQTYTVSMTVRYLGETYQRTWSFSVK